VSPPWTPFVQAGIVPPTEATVAEIARSQGLSETEARAAFDVALERGDRMYFNSRYQVLVRASDTTMVHLWIKRLDQEPIHDWRDLQRIKDELVGPDCEGVELYPARARIVDIANQYHMFVCVDPTFRFPWGFTEGLVNGDTSHAHGQRPIDAPDA
jgi:hypothetical protein